MTSPGHLLAGLLEEGEHHAVLAVAADEAVGGGVVDRVQAEGRPRPALLVGGEQRGQVEVGEDVAVQGQEASRSAPSSSAAKRIAPAVPSGSGSAT